MAHFIGLIGLFAMSPTIGNGRITDVAYYVATDGSDTNPGTIDRPFRTVTKAVTVLEPGATCYLRSGRYYETVRIKNLNGTAQNPIVFAAYRDEKVDFDGSVEIDAQWTVYKGAIYMAKLKRPVWQLFINRKSLCSARWPNGNWLDGTIWDKTKSMSWPEKGMSRFGHVYNRELKALDFSLSDGGIVIVNSGSFRTYKTFVLEHEPCSDNFTFDTANVQVHFSYEDHAEKHGYFLEGKLGLLDVEGEWFYEPEDSTVYVWPPGGANPNVLDVRGKTQSYSFDVSNSCHIKLAGIDFFGTTFRFLDCHYIVVEDCDLLYPSYSRRMLRSMGPIEVTALLVSNEFEPAYNIVCNCTFEYADGPGLELNGLGNRVENCYFHDIDYSCTYKGGYTLNMIDAPELVFRRNTVHTTGASETVRAGVRSVIELNDLSRSGHLQNDGAMIQVSVKQQDQSEIRFNWLHDTTKQGLRFDNSNKPNSPWGQNGRAHHNVAWRTDRIFAKGDKHFIYNNLSFDSHKNDLVISSDIEINGRNFSTITRNNIAGTLSGHITRTGREYSVPGLADHNWIGDVEHRDVRSQLRDPDNLDFRPRRDSELIDAGAAMEGFDHHYLGKAPDIGPYEYGDKNYWIPGRKWPEASSPVPPDKSTSVKLDVDLMWLGCYRAESHDVYFGTSETEIGAADRRSLSFKGNKSSNIFDSIEGTLQPYATYYWRIDAVRDTDTIKGRVWSFTTGSRLRAENSQLIDEGKRAR